MASSKPWLRRASLALKLSGSNCSACPIPHAVSAAVSSRGKDTDSILVCQASGGEDKRMTTFINMKSNRKQQTRHNQTTFTTHRREWNKRNECANVRMSARESHCYCISPQGQETGEKGSARNQHK